MNYSVTTKNNVLTTNTPIQADGFSSLFLKNIGFDAVLINDNIPLAAGSSFSFDNLPYVTIDEVTSIRFANVDLSQKVLIIKSYYKEVK